MKRQKVNMNIMESKTVSWQVRCRMEEQKGVHTGVSDMAHAWMPVRLMQSTLLMALLWLIKKLVKLVENVIPYKQKTFVQCNSNEKGKALMDVCQVGCIGCRLCERNCEAGAITVNNFLAHIDADKCTNCGVCAEKCPRKIITVRFEA